ncbi:MAG: hypothetical protein QNJ77_04725 [Acidimicrobiia bacterium]|nr:hypothetical protein [Acidimicrobiia bacterium]
MSPAPGKLKPVIVAAVLALDNADVAETVARIRRQVYETRRIVVVGAGSRGRHAADAAEVEWMSSVPHLLDSIDGSISHVWFLYAGALPRPDALKALIDEAERTDAAVAGSKLVHAEDPERLIAVGIATDVFNVPYLGMDEHEIDAGQYDVVRDVAAVAGVSMLIRRDLARGVGGPDPLLPPEAAAIDICQRARLRGARVVVVPSSEVLFHADRFRAESWRERAGRIRAMLKAYSLLTLLWVVPLRLVIGLLESVVSPFLGRWVLFDFLRAWLWNIWHLPSLVRERFSARKGRVFGDAELFRYQLRGSAKLSEITGEIGIKLRARLDRSEGPTLASIGSDLRQPAFVVGVLTLLTSVLAVRSLWSAGWPAVGYTMPLPESGRAALGAYAGGWNPAGFGSIEPLPPLVGLAGATQAILFDSPEFTAWLLSLSAIIAGIWGTIRLLRGWGIEVVAAWAAGIVLVAGPAAQAIGDRTAIGQLLGIGVLPWALRVATTRWPWSWTRRLGRVAAMGWVVALLALVAPPLVVAPVAILFVRAILKPVGWASWRAFGLGLVGSALAVPVLLPWLRIVDLEAYLTAGEEYWIPALIPLAAAGVAFLAGLLASRDGHLDAVILGGVLVGLGAVAARGADLGLGRETAVSGLAVVAAGTAFLVGGVLDALRATDVHGWRRLTAGFGGVAAIVLVATSLLPLYGGRGGLPNDEFTDSLRFTAAAEGEATASRILLVGPAASLPGDARTVRGADYRVVSAPVPALWEAYLPVTGPADAALEQLLLKLIEGQESRAGEALADFGIRWVVVTGETPLEAVFDGQLDLVPLGGAKRPTFLVDSPLAVRARLGTGDVWSRVGTGYRGTETSGERVSVAETANSRWQPGPWTQRGWGNEVSASTGEAKFDAIESRRVQASLAGGWFAILVLFSAFARRQR